MNTVITPVSMEHLAELNPELFMRIVSEAQDLYAAGYTFTLDHKPEDVFLASAVIQSAWDEMARIAEEDARIAEDNFNVSHGYTYINKDGEEVWTEDYEESIGE